MNLTKLDVLTGLDEVKIGVAYLHGGVEVKGMPASLKLYSSVTMKFEVMPGWSEDISKVRQ